VIDSFLFAIRTRNKREKETGRGRRRIEKKGNKPKGERKRRERRRIHHRFDVSKEEEGVASVSLETLKLCSHTDGTNQRRRMLGIKGLKPQSRIQSEMKT